MERMDMTLIKNKKLKQTIMLLFIISILGGSLIGITILLIKQSNQNNEIANKQLAIAIKLYKQGKYQDTTIALMLIPDIDSNRIEVGLEDVAKGKPQIVKDAINLDRLSYSKLYKDHGWYIKEASQLKLSYPMEGIITKDDIDGRINEITTFINKCETSVRESGLPAARWNRCGI
jgi:hypothetical protein